MSTNLPKILCFTDGTVISTDSLVNTDTAALLFGLKTTTFRQNVGYIIAEHGLQRVKTGERFKYRLQSIQSVIRKCAENEVPLYITGHNHKFKTLPPKGEQA